MTPVSPANNPIDELTLLALCESWIDQWPKVRTYSMVQFRSNDTHAGVCGLAHEIQRVSKQTVEFIFSEYRKPGLLWPFFQL